MLSGYSAASLASLCSVIWLAGCATPQNVSEQTAPLENRLQTLDHRLDGGLSQALHTAQSAARDAAAARDATQALAQRTADLERHLQSLAQAQQTQADQTRQMQQDLATMQQTLARGLQDIQAETRALRDALLAQADQKRTDAQNLATAQASAEASAQATDKRLNQLERRIEEVARLAEEALAALGLGPRKIFGKVIHSVALTDDKTLFPINSPELGERDLAKLNAVADYVKNMDVNYHIGIHGHTDGLGSDDYNFELGKARAEVVKRYLHEQRGIPLLRMSVISHGATGVTAYREGGNRRIVVEVLQ